MGLISVSRGLHSTNQRCSGQVSGLSSAVLGTLQEQGRNLTNLYMAASDCDSSRVICQAHQAGQDSIRIKMVSLCMNHCPFMEQSAEMVQPGRKRLLPAIGLETSSHLGSSSNSLICSFNQHMLHLQHYRTVNAAFRVPLLPELLHAS